MSPRERALGLARIPAAPPGPADEAAARLRALLDEIGALDRALEACSAELAAFSHRWERALGAAFAELAAAERLVRTLQALEDGLLSLAERIRAGAPPERPRGARRQERPAADAGAWDAPGERAPEADEPPAGPLEDEAAALKRLYRRLARLLHPDLARDAGEEARRSAAMARVNAAYARGDLAELQVMAERVGAGEEAEALGEAERLALLERRIETLRRIAASLARERDRLLRSDTERLRAEAARRGAAGGDLVEETRAELAAEAAAARADARVRLGRAAAAAAELSRARRKAMEGIERRGPTGARRAFDPLGESALVRLGAARLERRGASAEARALARALEDAARGAPWEVAITLLAFFAEEGGRRLPEAIATPEALERRWDALRAGWPAAPDLARMLAHLPRHLAVGAREGGGEVHAGVQLAAADLVPGVRIALERPAVAEVARAVLAALGPEETCPSCGASGPARHLYRTRGLDARHGIACAGCGAVLRSYWRYGEVDGLEALAPHALRLGLVAEVTAALAGTSIGFQLLPGEARALTAERLRRRFAELYLAPCEVDLAPEAILVSGDDGPLGKGARVHGRGPLRLGVAGDAGTTAEELLELLRSRIERRFRP